MWTLRGVVMAGLGQAGSFMGLPWVADGVRRLVGFTPYPGTLNVRLDPDTVDAWRQIRERDGLVLSPPAGQPCGARLFPVTLGPGVEAAVIVPDVTRHGDDVLEVVAPTALRRRLGLADGGAITLNFAEFRPLE
jgi:riboflavin kinase